MPFRAWCREVQRLTDDLQYMLVPHDKIGMKFEIGRALGRCGLDVFEDEPETKPGLKDCENAVIVPHIASASFWTRAGMVSLSLLLSTFRFRHATGSVQGSTLSQRFRYLGKLPCLLAVSRGRGIMLRKRRFLGIYAWGKRKRGLKKCNSISALTRLEKRDAIQLKVP